jgi:hypothetical protein
MKLFAEANGDGGLKQAGFQRDFSPRGLMPKALLSATPSDKPAS